MGEKYYCNYPTEPIGGRNPYYQCAHCKRSVPEINGKLDGHEKDCKYRLEEYEKIAKALRDYRPGERS